METSTDSPPHVEKHKSLTLSLRLNFGWTLLGNLIYAASQWGMLVILAKLGTPVLVGQFALGLAITAPVFMFANLQLRGIQATDTTGEYQFADYLGLRLLMCIGALCGIYGIVWWSDYHDETAVVIFAMGVAKASESLSDICYGFFQRQERMDCVAKSMLLKGPLSLLALGCGVMTTRSVLWGTIAMASVWIGLLIGYDLRQVRALLLADSPRLATDTLMLTRSRLARWNMPILLSLSRLALPLGIVMMLISLNTNIPRYFVERLLGEESLGIYAALAYVIVAGNTVISALGQSASPRLARHYVEGNRHAFVLLLLKLCGLGAIIGIAGVLLIYNVGDAILQVLYRSEYSQHDDVFLWIMIAGGFGYVASFLGYGMTAARYFRIQTPLFAVVMGVTVTVCSLFVPKYGLIGAAQASAVAAVVSVVGALLVNVWAFRQLPAHRTERKRNPCKEGHCESFMS